MRPNSAFDQCATKTWVRSFWGANHGLNFLNFDLERLWTFTAMVPKVSHQDFLPILGALEPKITNQSFWPLWDQMVLLTGMRPKPGFGPFNCCVTISLSWYFWPMVRLMGGEGGLRDWYYTTPRKKIQFTPFQIQKLYWLLRNCSFWRITLILLGTLFFTQPSYDGWSWSYLSRWLKSLFGSLVV